LDIIVIEEEILYAENIGFVEAGLRNKIFFNFQQDAAVSGYYSIKADRKTWLARAWYSPIFGSLI
jgi:hypothetical protein